MTAQCFLSIDFEDANHDFKRQNGIDLDPPLIEDKLWAAYNKIENFCQDKLNGARLTFFCTGIIAKKCPEIIAKIAEDGHEIGCHYFQHDWVNKDSPADFDKNIKEAVHYLRKASGQPIKGFRAPYFSIEHTDIEHYRILEKYFVYDSSLVVNSKEQADEFMKKLGLEKLIVFPVLKHKVYSYLPQIRSGGTFLKFFPSSSIIKVINESIKQEISPMVYLHPYEFVTDLSFKMPFSEMKNMSLKNKLISWTRQYQWHYFGNHSVLPKLEKVFSKFKNGEKIENLLS